MAQTDQAAAPAGTTIGGAGAGSVQQIVVTGSSIRGVAPVGSAIVSLGADDIKKAGVATAADLVRLLPSVSGLGSDSGRRTGAQGADSNVFRGTGINLRGLGTESTLTLVDGRRQPTSSAGDGKFFDISDIPQLAIQRIEVVPDGASAVYGSDAVGGVVNVILRDHFDGVETTARYGGARNMNEYQFGVAAGKTWSSGSALLVYERYYRSRLAASDRPSLFNDDQRAFGGYDQRPYASNPGTLYRTVPAGPGTVQVPTNGIPAGQNGSALQTSQLTATPNRQSAWLGADGLPRLDRDNLVVRLRQELTDRIKVFVDGHYSDHRFDVYTTAANAVLSVPLSNAFVTPSLAAAFPTGLLDNYSFYKDFGAIHTTGYERTLQIVTGLDVDLGGQWNGEVYGEYSMLRDHSLATNGGAINNAALNAALASANPATAFNPFGDGSATNASVLASINGFQEIHPHYTQNYGGAKADGPLWSIPGGQVRLAVGGEYREERRSQIVTNNSGPPNTSVVTTTVYPLISRNITSVYGELFVPLIGSGNAGGLARSLDLSVAVRYDRYSDFGGTTNPKFGVNWQPTDDLKLHASYSKSFRAPSLGDLQPGAGVPTRQVAVGPTITVLRLGGQPGLKPETASTYSFGTNYKPSFAPGLNLSANYFNITDHNKLDNPANPGSLSQPSIYAPYLTFRPASTDAAGTANFNALVTQLVNSSDFVGARPAVSSVQVVIDGRRFNSGTYKVQGLDLAGDYRWSTGFGDITLGETATVFLEYKNAVTPTAPLASVIGRNNYPVRWTSRTQLGWTKDGFSAIGFLNYESGYRNAPPAASTSAPPEPLQNVGAYATFDLTLAYSTAERPRSQMLRNIQIDLTVRNLFDRDPPVALVAASNGGGATTFDPQYASPIGRQIAVQVSKRW